MEPDVLRPWWQLSGLTRVRGTDRFWAKVEKTRDPAACWPWRNGRNGAGYGVIVWHGKRTYAHRLAYELYHGHPVPAHLVVRHLCGNQLCCRPSHLAVGRPADNSADMVAMGRWRNRALSYDQVRSIRDMAQHKTRIVDIALHFGVTQRTIWKVVTRRTYKHVGDLFTVQEVTCEG